MTPTDTPRTDAASCGLPPDSWELEQLSGQLELELKESKAEVKRLRGLINESILEKSNLSMALFNCQTDLRASKAEVERLTRLLNVPLFVASDGTVTPFNPPSK